MDFFLIQKRKKKAFKKTEVEWWSRLLNVEKGGGGVLRASSVTAAGPSGLALSPLSTRALPRGGPRGHCTGTCAQHCLLSRSPARGALQAVGCTAGDRRGVDVLGALRRARAWQERPGPGPRGFQRIPCRPRVAWKRALGTGMRLGKGSPSCLLPGQPVPRELLCTGLAVAVAVAGGGSDSGGALAGKDALAWRGRGVARGGFRGPWCCSHSRHAGKPVRWLALGLPQTDFMSVCFCNTFL